MASDKEFKLSEQANRLQQNLENGINISDRIIRIDSEIDSNMVARIDAGMSEIERDSRKGVIVRITSFGGSAYDALAIIGRLRASNCQITTEGYGYVMSAATLILAAGHKRKISKYTWVMHHEAQYDVEGSHKRVKDFVGQVEKEEKNWAKFMAEFTGYKTEKFWSDLGTDKDYYLSANEALKFGIVDEVIND